MKKIVLLSSILFAFSANTQNILKVSFEPYNANQPLVFNTTLEDLNGRFYDVATLYYYVSNVHVIHDGGQDLDLSANVYIVKNEDFLFDFGSQNVTSVESINFSIGVPQAINHLDISTYAIGSALSYQSPSMQWGWTTGYNQVGIVGRGDSNTDGTPETAFQLFPLSDALFQNITLTTPTVADNGVVEINIHTNLDQWLKNINPATNGILHGSSGNNVTLMNNTQNFPVFTFVQSFAGVSEAKLQEGVINYSLTDHSIEIKMSEFVNADNYNLINMNGQVLKSGNIVNNNDVVYLDNVLNGSYWFQIFSNDGNKLNNVRIIK